MKIKVHSPIPAKHLRRILMLVWIAIVIIAPWLTLKQNWGNGYEPYVMGQYVAIADRKLTPTHKVNLLSNVIGSMSFDRLAYQELANLEKDWPLYQHLYMYPIIVPSTQPDGAYHKHRLWHYLSEDKIQCARLYQRFHRLKLASHYSTAKSDPYWFETFSQIISVRGGITPAHFEILLDAGYQLNQFATDGNTPLTLTLISNLQSDLSEDPSIAYLLKHGADPNLYAEQQEHAFPPLFYTRYDTNDPHIELLLQYGANPYFKVRGESFIDLLRRQGLGDKADDIEARYPAHIYAP